MNWDALGAIGEVVGAAAVVLTLAYLAVQVRQNTRSTQAATHSATTAGWQDYLQTQSVEDLDILLKLNDPESNLTHAEFLRAYYMCLTMFRRMEHDFYQFRAGVFSESTWDAYVRAFEMDIFVAPATRAMWKLQLDTVDPEFGKYMSKVVDRVSKRPSELHMRRKFSELLSEQLEEL